MSFESGRVIISSRVVDIFLSAKDRHDLENAMPEASDRASDDWDESDIQEYSYVRLLACEHQLETALQRIRAELNRRLDEDLAVLSATTSRGPAGPPPSSPR
jgi:hypothetical protein